LVLLSFTVALAQFTALVMEDGTGKTMTAFTALELN
jgi:ABC-type dipeptide/oligopeptide/nickel transport system ATPase component